MTTFVNTHLLAIRIDTTTLHVLGNESGDWRWSSAIVDIRDDGATTRSGNEYRFGTRVDDIDAADKRLLKQVVERDGPLLVVPTDVKYADLEPFIVVGRAHAAAREIAIANAKSWPKSMRVMAPRDELK
jgi:hypothetical protein